MADTIYSRTDRNISPPRRDTDDLAPIDPRDATILVMTAVGIAATALLLGAASWSALRVLPYPSTLLFDIPACAAGVVFTATLLALAKFSGLWK